MIATHQSSNWLWTAACQPTQDFPQWFHRRPDTFIESDKLEDMECLSINSFGRLHVKYHMDNDPFYKHW